MGTMLKRKALVTGGAGFVGANLVRRLLKDGSEVTVLDNLSTGRRENIAELLSIPGFVFVEGDVSSPADLSSGFDRIYNLACPASPSRYQKDPIKTLKTTVLGTLNMLELARQSGARILQASTSEVYGDPAESPQKESYWGNVNPVGVRACYDEGKRAAETACTDYARMYGMDVRIVRIFNTYGPFMDQNDGRVVSNFVIQALKNEPLTVYGDGSQTRSFQYVDDLIEGLVRMMENDKKITGPVNIGNPGEFTVLELTKQVLILIPESKSSIAYSPLPADDPKRRKPDITLAKTELNWEPEVQLADGLLKTIAYFKSTLEYGA